ncbi:MAG: DUF4296 domain-containing protein [Bacteroidetes bacterium]|nr:DUF4296 domain-containing protein [Bacteroidota bacterium]
MKYFFTVIFFFTFIACTDSDTTVPKDVLPVNKMKLIVWDLVQAGAYASTLSEKDTAEKNLNTAYLTETLKMHQISKKDFFKSFNFYQQHPVLNKQLFDSITAYAQRQRTKMYKNAY